MTKKKFNRKAFVDWLDVLAKVCVKTRDEFVCQIECHHPDCPGKMQPLNYDCQWCHIKSKKSYQWRWDLINAVCGFSKCHERWHSDGRIGDWFAKKYPDRDEYLSRHKPIKSSWKEKDFREIESYLLQKTKDLEVDPDVVPVNYRKRFIRKIEELR